MSARLSTPHNKSSNLVSKGTYYTRNGRLYCIIDVDLPGQAYKVENCETLFADWITAEALQLSAKEVNILGHVRNGALVD